MEPRSMAQWWVLRLEVFAPAQPVRFNPGDGAGWPLNSQKFRGEDMKNLVLRFINDTEGQDLIEYALLAALVALGAVAGMTALAGGINKKFSDVSSSLNTAS